MTFEEWQKTATSSVCWNDIVAAADREGLEPDQMVEVFTYQPGVIFRLETGSYFTIVDRCDCEGTREYVERLLWSAYAREEIDAGTKRDWYSVSSTPVGGGVTVSLALNGRSGELLRNFSGEHAHMQASAYAATLREVADTLNAAPAWGWGAGGEKPVTYVACKRQITKGCFTYSTAAVFAGGRRAVVEDYMMRDEAREVVKRLNRELKGGAT